MKRKFIAIVITAVLISGALFTKSYMDLKNSTLYSMLVENLEALTKGDTYVINTPGFGTCGMKYVNMFDDTVIRCNLDFDMVGFFFRTEANPDEPFNWCCESCGSSTYCGSMM